MGETLIGKRFNRLVVVGYHAIGDYVKKEDNILMCKCDCGGIKIAPLSRLKNGLVSTCGCAWKTARRGKK